MAAPAAVPVARDAGASPSPNPEHLARLGLGVGLCFVWSPGGVGPMGGVRLSFDVRPTAWLTLRTDGWITVLARDLEQVGANASFHAAAFRLTGFYELMRRGVVRPAIGVGGGGIVVWARGVGSGDYDGAWETAIAGYAGGAARVAFVIGEWFRAELGAAAGAVMPEVNVRFGGDSVATFGRPAIDAFAEAELSFL